ncbi:MAG: TetR/AcrR family transcriptional regulator [Lentimicrobiaceae bacterium]|jgi:AcrR family transcriptional regulator
MDEKLDHILSESLRLFRKNGIRSVSMDDIAKELGMSKKTIYQYVANKTDLVEMVLNYMLAKESTVCLSEEEKKLNAIDVLLAVSRNVSNQMKDLNPINAFELQKYYPAIFREFVIKKRDHVFEQVKQNFAQGISEGIYRTDLDIELVARLYIQKLVDVHNPEFLESVNFGFEKVFLVMFDNHIRGIANAEGLAYYEKQIKKSNINL